MFFPVSPHDDDDDFLRPPPSSFFAGKEEQIAAASKLEVTLPRADVGKAEEDEGKCPLVSSSTPLSA